jgi:ribosomal 30S subunit maturation factor RimM
MRETMEIHTDSILVKPQRSERKFLLSEMLGSKVFLHEKKIGTLSDLMIVETGRIPEVVNFVITRPFGDPPLLVPYERIVTLEPPQLVIDSDDL